MGLELMILPRQDYGLRLNILENQGIFKKSTKIFHGPFSERP